MKSLPFALTSIALAVFAGCAAEPTHIAAAPAPIVLSSPLPQGSTMVTTSQTVPLRAGMGRIQSILALPSGGVASGATNTASNRISAKMDDGSMQYFDTQAVGLAVGDRIEITSDRMLRHPA